METKNLESILGEHPFFKNLEGDLVKFIAGCASNVPFEAGQYIFHEGEEANHFYIIRQGRVAVEIPSQQKGPVKIQTLGAEDVLGWSWFVPPYLWHFDARVLGPTRAIALDAKCLRQKMEENHTLGYQLLKQFIPVIVERLQSTRLQLLDFYGIPQEPSSVWEHK